MRCPRFFLCAFFILDSRRMRVLLFVGKRLNKYWGIYTVHSANEPGKQAFKGRKIFSFQAISEHFLY